MEKAMNRQGPVALYSRTQWKFQQELAFCQHSHKHNSNMKTQLHGTDRLENTLACEDQPFAYPKTRSSNPRPRLLDKAMELAAQQNSFRSPVGYPSDRRGKQPIAELLASAALGNARKTTCFHVTNKHFEEQITSGLTKDKRVCYPGTRLPSNTPSQPELAVKLTALRVA